VGPIRDSKRFAAEPLMGTRETCRASVSPVRLGLPANPAPVHVDCAGPVREDVPGNGLLGDGLTGEHHWLVAWLQRCTPAIPLRGLGGRGGGDRHVNSGNANRVSVGRVRSALL